ncbi:MAG: glycosyltransferase family 2 protein [Micavibrio aeruginosavorus]|uniref:Glycosyltransferase family 2 protein n=1 Tax=Micavibrio aeruginosavorus TaxID=349221 RepID=A0A2W5MRX0_9BACT|nr:MAG: glycosyltransferase family 2 protein [Micavibrio aeruginosavorus]
MPCGRLVMRNKIPVSAVIVTRNEEKNLGRCLASLEDFAQILVVDSNSTDATASVAQSYDVSVIPFVWNGAYPKKRQWILDNVSLEHDWVFFIDADEAATPELCAEIAGLDWRRAGYFVKGFYVVNGRRLRFGITNKKLCLLNRKKMQFPVIDDLDISGMGEIEGHYQPVLKAGEAGRFSTLRHGVLHYALEDISRYESRHDDYADWHAVISAKKGLPDDPVKARQIGKQVLRHLPFRNIVFCLYYYVVRLGILEYKHHKNIFRAKEKYHSAG